MTPDINLTPPDSQSRPILDRTARERRLRTLKRIVAATGLAGVGIFSGLAAANTHAGSSHTTANPDGQITNLENAQGGSFFSTGGGFAPPSGSSSAPQASSGGS